MIKDALQNVGYEVLEAVDGIMGLNMVRKEMPDLILLDVLLPKMDGFKVCRMLKFDDRYKDIPVIPVILLTACSADEDRAVGGEVGANLYLNKPFEAEDLLGKIKELIP